MSHPSLFRLFVAISVLVSGGFLQGSQLKRNEQAAEAAATLGQELREKAAQGDKNAQNALGGFAQMAGDFLEAAMWFGKAAEQGDASAEGSLGSLYRTGRGVAQDFAEAYKWSRAAADQGDPLGQFNVAGLNYLGQGRPVNMNEAVKWARAAAEQDCGAKFRLASICARAQTLLAGAYLLGQGVPQDYVLAHMWANLSAATLTATDDGEKAAIALREGAARNMTPEQIGEAQRLAREWRPKVAK